jgi:glutamine cyclotransferase
MKRKWARFILFAMFVATFFGIVSYLYFQDHRNENKGEESSIDESEEGDGIVNYTYTIVNTYPHSQTSFTQGLIYEDGYLYEGTGLNKHSSVRKLELATGNVLQKYNLPSQYFGEGITILKDKIYQLTWQSNLGFVYDKRTFGFLEEFSYATEGWGLTCDGENLIMSDGSEHLYFLDPLTFKEVHRIEVLDEVGPVNKLNELEYINGSIYANVWQSDYIVIIDPESGKVIGKINLEGLLDPSLCIEECDVLNGIAYDAEGDRLFVTGKWWPKVFEIDLVRLD